MALETVTAKMQLKDENGNAIVDEEGKVTTQETEVTYDFGDDLSAAVELCGEDTVFSNYKANARVALQSIIRTGMKAGLSADQIQARCDAWKPGMVAERVQVDPSTAIANAWENWSDEKKAEFLAKLGVQA